MLGTEEIDMNDNFFELGGHSLLAARIVTRLRAQYDVSLPMSAIFLTPKIMELAERPEFAALHVWQETGTDPVETYPAEVKTPIESREEIEL